MSDYSELERLAEAANAVTGDVAVDIAISSESGPNQAEIDAVTAYVGVATPATILALIAENDLQRKDLQNLRADNAQLIYALKQEQKSYLVLRDERDRLRAEVAGLRTGYEAYERVNAELKAECEALRVAGAGALRFIAFAFDEGVEGAEMAGRAIENAIGAKS